MAHIHIDINLTKEDKFIDLVARLKVEKRDVLWNLVHFWSWVAKKHPAGILKNISDFIIAHQAEWPGDPKTFVNALVDSKFIDRCDGCLLVHDWDRWRPDSARLKSRRMSDEYPTNVGKTSAQEEKRESPLSAPAPLSKPLSPSPISHPKERKEEVFAAGAAASNSKLNEAKKDTTQHWALIVDHIKRKWEYKYRPHGKFLPTGQDWANLKVKVRHYGAFLSMAVYDEFIVTPDDFWRKNGYSITMFCKAFDSLLERPGLKEKADRYLKAAYPQTDEHKANVAKLGSILTDMTKGKVGTAISEHRKKVETDPMGLMPCA